MSRTTSVQTPTLPPLVPGERLDRATFHARYEAMPPRTRAELINGVVYMTSPLGIDHGGTGPLVAYWLTSYRIKTPGVAVYENTTVILDDYAEFQPDYTARILPEFGGSTVDDDGYLRGAPELVVEVARSSRAFDLGAKKREYERVGVREYLVIALEPNGIHWDELVDGSYRVIEPEADGVHRSRVFPGLWLDADAFFRDDVERLPAILQRGLGTAEHADFVMRLESSRNQGRA